MGMFDAVDYIVRELDGDYAHLQRLDDLNSDLKPVARALLPDSVSEGTRLRYEMMEYEIL